MKISAIRLAAVCSFVLWLTFASATKSHAQKNPDRPPNVVLIVADDLGYRELGCFGQQKIRTPRLDALARQGARLTQHYSGNAVCAPSRCVLMTGKHPGHAAIRDNRATPPEGQWPLAGDAITLTGLMRDHGYTTGVFGKWGLGGPESSGEPMRQGVDRFYGYYCQSHAHSYYPDYLWSDARRVALANRPAVPGHAPLREGDDPNDPRSYDRFQGQDYAPDRINAAALEFIREHRERPFFLYYPSVIPHVALHVPDEDLKPYHDLGWQDPPFTRESGRGYTPHFTPRAAYAAMISRLDRYVGKVLDLLDELELSDDTLVIFTSDNGTTHLQEEVDYEFFNSVGELRGLKGSLYEGGVRVPTIVRWPGRVTAGTTIDYVSGFEDWLPTILDATGGREAIPTDVDGLSLVSVLQGERQAPRPYLYREFPGYGGQQSIRVGDWKAIRQNMNRGDLEIELYDLATDIGERHDVAGQHPDVVERMARWMSQHRVASETFPLIPLDAPPKSRGR